MTEFVSRFKQSLLKIDNLETKRIISEAGKILSPIDIAVKIVLPVLEQIGQDWNDGILSLSQIYMSGRMCEKLIDEILPLADPTRKNQPVIAITTLNDYHMLGKRIVYSHLRSVGYDLLDYGRTDVDNLISLIIKDKVEIILISTLMYPSALRVREVRNKLKMVSYSARILVGGAPFNFDDQLWKEVGADAMGHNSADAIEYINNLRGSVNE